MMSRFKVWDSGPSHARGVGFIVGATSQDVEDPSQSLQPPATSSQSSMDILVAKVRELRKETQVLRKEFQH